jgi:hypothetical protein
VSDHVCACVNCDEAMATTLSAPVSGRRFSAGEYNPEVPIRRGACRITLDGVDVTMKATQGAVGTDGWVALLSEHHGAKHACANHAPFLHPGPSVCIEIRRGQVTAEPVEVSA